MCPPPLWVRDRLVVLVVCRPLSVVFCDGQVLLRAVHLLFPDFAFMWLVEEAKKNMPMELDFLNEGHNAEKVAKMLAHFSFLKVTAGLTG